MNWTEDILSKLEVELGQDRFLELNRSRSVFFKELRRYAQINDIDKSVVEAVFDVRQATAHEAGKIINNNALESTDKLRLLTSVRASFLKRVDSLIGPTHAIGLKTHPVYHWIQGAIGQFDDQ